MTLERILGRLFDICLFTGYALVALTNAFLLFKDKVKERRFIKECKKQGMRFKQSSPMRLVGGLIQTIFNLFLPFWNFLIFITLIADRKDFEEYMKREVLRRKVEEE